MIKDENITLPDNPNEEQIESEMAGVPLNKVKKKRFKIYTEIISALLKHEALSESEIGDECGYKEKGTDKFSNVDRQIKKLDSTWNYIEHVPESKSKYRIKRDLDLIRLIYDNKIFSAIRSDFSASTWLMEILVKEHMQEFSTDKEFIEDLKKMIRISSSMFNFFLRGNADLNANLGTILGPPIPLVKTPGLNMAVLKSLTRKCSVYDLFITCMCLDHDVQLMSKDFPEESFQIFDEMKQKSAQNKLKAINYILSFTMMQNLARCADATQDNEGQIPLFFEDLVKNFNTIAKRINSDKTDRESLETAVRDMGDLYNKISKSLDDSSPIDRISGLIVGMGPTSKIVMKKSDKG